MAHAREYFKSNWGKETTLQQRTPHMIENGLKELVLNQQDGGKPNGLQTIILNMDLVKQILPKLIYFSEHGILKPNMGPGSMELFTAEDYDK